MRRSATDSDVVAFPGVAKALARLRDAGSRLGIVTAGQREIVEPQLAQTGLADLLETRVFGDDLDGPQARPGAAP